MFGLDATKLILLAILAAFLLGPSRMAAAAGWLAGAVQQLRAFTEATKSRAREEIGDEFDDIDWKALDPRRYDPRQIIAEAMMASPNPTREITPSRSAAADPVAPDPDSSTS